MMGKSHPPDKRPDGMHACGAGMRRSIPCNGVSQFGFRYDSARTNVGSAPSNKRKRLSKDVWNDVVPWAAWVLGAATAGILARGGPRIVVNYSSSKNGAEASAEACRKA